MRLKQIKLSGFKSFVDATAFEVPGQRVGVVGPNGCGKSNIMDAVRWVLGESKASELRGESMQDVIFSGSSERKPASRAAVELVFDNSLGRIGGSWGTFAELAVKRVLTRDGQSSYSINNQVVRRKDVHDLFMGTGLGPRAYAIIGQGMISRIIEARPEDLRVFLEEAAGISKYKERRRETENRLGDTRENLTRVDDIQRELGTQLEKLAQQAAVAQQFRDLEAERERKQHMLWLVRRDETLAEQQRWAALAADALNTLEGSLAGLRALESELETLRSAHYAAGDAVHAAQARFYETNAEVARLESDIRQVVQAQGQLGERIGVLADQERRARDDAQQAERDVEAGRGSREAAQGLADALAERLTELTEASVALEAQAREARNRYATLHAAALQTSQAIALSATRQRAAERSCADAQRRQERLLAELALVQAPPEGDLIAIREALAVAEAEEQVSADEQLLAEEAWRSADAARAPAQQHLRAAEAKLTQIEARITALRHLQERTQSQSRIGPWLLKHGLQSMARLWQRLRIEEGWETALESVLRERVEALEIGRLESISALAVDTPPAKVAFFLAQPRTSALSGPAGLRPLQAVVHGTAPELQPLLVDWLQGIWVAESLDQALARRTELPAGGRFITRQGHLVGALSLQFYAPDSEQEGLLVRQHELENLGREQRAQHLLADDARVAAVRAESLALECTQRSSQARDAHNRAVREFAAIRLDAQRLEQQLERARQTRERLDHDLAEVAEAIASAQASIEEEAAVFERLDLELAERQQAAEEAAMAAEDDDQRLTAHREQVRQAERDAQEASFATREIGARIERLSAQIDQLQRLEAQTRNERLLQQDRLAELSDAVARAALDAALSARLQAEQGLTAARQSLETLTQRLKSHDEQRLSVERQQEPLRGRVADLQLKEQAARLNLEQFSSLLQEHGVDEAQVRAGFTESPRAAWLQGEVTRLSHLVSALGAVNLAALEELGLARERKAFLDAQTADLNEAITTMEDAIRRIDRETRELLKSTYDAVNRGFGELFPELFGGGEARLILTGDEILDAGIQVMAQPPGKRNSSIHLLSGGEKALTAIALVFAMFQLNPAPFCLLDEVDAPLDDANTERYCDMVRRMSDNTQFLFITHNKIAMELAQQLVGVTMQERGVSRIVAVDLDSAALMAQAA